MNFEQANVEEAKKLLIWWSRGALLPPGTLSDVMSVLAGDKNRVKMDTFVRSRIRRRRILDEGVPS